MLFNNSHTCLLMDTYQILSEMVKKWAKYDYTWCQEVGLRRDNPSTDIWLLHPHSPWNWCQKIAPRSPQFHLDSILRILLHAKTIWYYSNLCTDFALFRERKNIYYLVIIILKQKNIIYECWMVFLSQNKLHKINMIYNNDGQVSRHAANECIFVTWISILIHLYLSMLHSPTYSG